MARTNSIQQNKIDPTRPFFAAVGSVDIAVALRSHQPGRGPDPARQGRLRAQGPRGTRSRRQEGELSETVSTT